MKAFTAVKRCSECSRHFSVPRFLYFQFMIRWTLFIPIAVSVLTFSMSCKRATQQQTDTLYSRHLQRQVDLKIFHTKITGNRDELNLLLLNDGADVEKLHAFATVDSLFGAGEIASTVVVAIDVADRMQEYGVAGKPDYEKRGSKADHYDAFVANELLPYIRKKTETRKFREVAIAGASR